MQWCEQDLLVEAEGESFKPGMLPQAARVHGAFPGRREKRMWYLARVKPGELVHGANGSRDFFPPL